MNLNIKNKYPDFDWIMYKELNPYLYIIGLRTQYDYENNYINEGIYKGRIYNINQKKNYSYHILLPSIGNKSIFNILSLLKNQLLETDYLTIVFDGIENSLISNEVNEYCKNFICKINIIIEHKNLGYWGHGIRNKYNDLEGDFIYHIDDDDIIYDDTFYNIRKYCIQQNTIYIFKIILENNSIIWKKHEIEKSKISTQSGVIPSYINKEGYWDLKYGGDYNFYKNLSEKFNTIFIDKIIYKKL